MNFSREDHDLLDDLLKQTHNTTNSHTITNHIYPETDILDGIHGIKMQGVHQSISDYGRYGSFLEENLNSLDSQQPSQELFQDPFFKSGENLSATFSTDVPSSLGSMINSDLLSPSSFTYQPQMLNSSDSQNLTNSIRSPSTSLRLGSHLSTSAQKGHRRTSISSTATTPMMEPTLNGSTYTQDEKLRRRREFHNAVERRRRELIKSKIKELGKIIPSSLLNYDNDGKEVKANKGIILNRTVEYLEYLIQVIELQDRKKIQLLNKIQLLETKKSKIFSDPNTSSLSSLKVKTIAGSSDQLIDTRSVPHMINDAHNNIFDDDLNQFLSGNLMEQEDNTKLIFNSSLENAADFLLEFKK